MIQPKSVKFRPIHISVLDRHDGTMVVTRSHDVQVEVNRDSYKFDALAHVVPSMFLISLILLLLKPSI
jgi:hypothetical protein